MIPLQERLEEKVRKYLAKGGSLIVDGTICYTGIMEDMEMPDGKKLPLHRVSYTSPVLRGEGVHRNVIYIALDTEKLFMIVTPHYFEFINDDE
jgi:hypothetical protein